MVGAGAVALDESQYHEEEGYGEYGEWDGDTGLDPSGLQDGNKGELSVLWVRAGVGCFFSRKNQIPSSESGLAAKA